MRSELEALTRTPLPPTPFDNRSWPAPLPPIESIRQAIVSELDLLGTRRRPFTTASSDITESLQDHVAFTKIVERCKDLFQIRVGMLTILDEDRQLFLTTGGMPDGGKSLPREVTFCSHAILNDERGLVVLDSQKE